MSMPLNATLVAALTAPLDAQSDALGVPSWATHVFRLVAHIPPLARKIAGTLDHAGAMTPADWDTLRVDVAILAVQFAHRQGVPASPHRKRLLLRTIRQLARVREGWEPTEKVWLKDREALHVAAHRPLTSDPGSTPRMQRALIAWGAAPSWDRTAHWHLDDHMRPAEPGVSTQERGAKHPALALVCASRCGGAKERLVPVQNALYYIGKAVRAAEQRAWTRAGAP